MERQLVVSFVCLELKDGCLGTQYTTLKEIHSREHFVVSYRAFSFLLHTHQPQFL